MEKEPREYEIECLFCPHKVDSGFAWSASVYLIKKHVREQHRDKVEKVVRG
jgi:hypothetical protein